MSSETVPQLITVQKGILALMRQWKNVLYMPNLSEINFKVSPETCCCAFSEISDRTLLLIVSGFMYLLCFICMEMCVFFLLWLNNKLKFP